MGQIDIATKMFVSISDIFAQIFNVGLFQGDIVVREDGLTDLNSLEDIRLEGKEKLFEKIRDIKKQSDLGFSLAILGIEDQDKIHQFMPVRTMMYDAAAYEVQFRRIIEECEQKGVTIPYGMGVPRGTQVLPVITIIFYTGKEIWDGPRDLFSLLKVPENKKELLKKYMNNYCIHVIDARHMSDEEINRYSGDLKAFFIMLKEKYDEEMLRGVIAKHKETWYALSTIKKDKRYKDYVDTISEKELAGGVDMCETLDFIEKRGIEQGIEQGIKGLVEAVKEFTNSKEATINSLMKSYQLTEEVAKEKVELYWTE